MPADCQNRPRIKAACQIGICRPLIVKYLASTMANGFVLSTKYALAVDWLNRRPAAQQSHRSASGCGAEDATTTGRLPPDEEDYDSRRSPAHRIGWLCGGIFARP